MKKFAFLATLALPFGIGIATIVWAQSQQKDPLWLYRAEPSTVDHNAANEAALTDLINQQRANCLNWIEDVEDQAEVAAEILNDLDPGGATPPLIHAGCEYYLTLMPHECSKTAQNGA